MRFQIKVGLLMIATLLLCAGAIGTANAKEGVSCPTTNSLQLRSSLKGLYNFTISGLPNQHEQYLVAAVGVFQLDGRGNVTGGRLTVNCSNELLQDFLVIEDGCYSVNTDGTGFMSWALDDLVCESGEDGIDFNLAVNSSGILLTSDASDANFDTGSHFQLIGSANTNAPLILPFQLH